MINERTREKLISWLRINPEIANDTDRNRFFEFIYEACLHNDEIDNTALDDALGEAQPKWGDDLKEPFIDEFLVLIERLKDFGLFYQGKIDTALELNQ